MKHILFLVLLLAPATVGADKVWNSGKGATWDCKKDPVVTVNASKGTWTFKGACKSITLNGSSIKAKAETADELTISGAMGTVTIGTVGAITVTGAKNKVTWSKAQSGDAPSISNSGVENAITQSGAPAAPAGKTADTTKPAASGTAWDCAKSPSFVNNDNDGSYTLTGKCKEVLVNGNNNKIKVESAAFVALNGNKNTVEGGLTSVDCTGNDNSVAYKGGKPKWMNSGNGNKLTAAK